MSRNSSSPAVEALESRRLLAGNVLVSVVDGDLVVTGDGAKNRILIDAAGLAAGEVRVRPADDTTTVNGDPQVVLSGFAKSVRIEAGPGADYVGISDLMIPGDISVNAGRSGDTVSLNRVEVAGRGSLLGLGGDDSFVVLQSRIARAAEVRGDDGDDHITLDRSTFGGRTVVLGGLGDDTFSVDTAVFEGENIVNGQKGQDRVVEGIQADYVFASRQLGWQADFSDYPVGREADWEIDAGLRTPPAELGWQGKGFLLSANNHSDDVFMYLRRQITGLKPNTAYQVRIAVTFGSAGTSGSVGIGGSPGDSVFLKAGATTNEPQRIVNEAADWRMTIDKADQGEGGADMGVVSTIANGIKAEDASDPPAYREVERTYVHPTSVMTDAQMRLWVIVGTDSGYEGTTTLYYRAISVRLVEA
jgi:hypothetical protein